MSTITVTSPTGGVWYFGSVHNITWTCTAESVGQYQVLTLSGPDGWGNSIGYAVPAVSGQTSYSVPWTVSSPPADNYTIVVLHQPDPGVWSFDYTGESATFTISYITITITSPVGGDKWLKGSVHDVTWTIDAVLGAGEFRFWTVDQRFANWYQVGAGIELTNNTTSYSIPWTIDVPTSPQHSLCVFYRLDTGVWSWVSGSWTGLYEVTTAMFVPSLMLRRAI
jgi:hypothetical protein